MITIIHEGSENTVKTNFKTTYTLLLFKMWSLYRIVDSLIKKLGTRTLHLIHIKLFPLYNKSLNTFTLVYEYSF